MSLPTNSGAAKPGLKGWHVLAILLGFFGSVMTVNVVMAALAISTFSGVDGVDTYQHGLGYNKTIAEAAQQERVGWTNAIAFAGNGSGLTITLIDREARPVPALTITGTIGRGATDQFDRVVAFHETVPGVYEAPLGVMPPGSWFVSLEATGTAGTYRLKERLWLKKP
jgi:nitrogen fixation protein FixH